MCRRGLRSHRVEDVNPGLRTCLQARGERCHDGREPAGWAPETTDGADVAARTSNWCTEGERAYPRPWSSGVAVGDVGTPGCTGMPSRAQHDFRVGRRAECCANKTKCRRPLRRLEARPRRVATIIA